MPLTALFGLAALSTPPALADTPWTLVSIRLGHRWITLSQQVPKPTLLIRGQNATGFTACSPLTGKAIYAGSRLSFEALDAGPDDQCPDRIIDLREDYVNLLSGAMRYQIRGDTLTIWAKSGALLFRASRE